jgi:hypothetical protein
LPETKSHLLPFFFFLSRLVVAWYIVVKSEWNPIAHLYNRVCIQIAEHFTDMWHVRKAVCTVLTKKYVKWDTLVTHPNNYLLEKFSQSKKMYKWG